MNVEILEDKARYVADLANNLLFLREIQNAARAHDLADVLYDVAVRQIPRTIEFQKLEDSTIRQMRIYSIALFDPYTTHFTCVQVVEETPKGTFQPRRFRLNRFLNSINDTI